MPRSITPAGVSAGPVNPPDALLLLHTYAQFHPSGFVWKVALCQLERNGIILKLLICPYLNILCDDIQISRTSLPRCRVDMPARGCRWSVRGGRGVLQGGGGRASTPPWWRGSPGTAAAQPVGSIESTGRETSPSRQVCSIPPAQLSLNSSDVKKPPPSRACSPPISSPRVL